MSWVKHILGLYLHLHEQLTCSPGICNTSRPTVHTNLLFVAMCCIWCFYDRLKMDSTDQVLSAHLHKDLLRDQETASWKILVVRWMLVWLSASGIVRHLYLIIPPMLLLGPQTGGAYWDAICESLCVQQILDFISFMRGIALQSMQLKELDNASQNTRLVAHEETTKDYCIFYVVFYCLLHQNMHGVGSVCLCIGAELIAAAYSLAHLLRQGTYFVRLLLATPDVLRNIMSVTNEPPSDAETNLLDTMMHIFYEKPGRGSTKKQRFLVV